MAGEVVGAEEMTMRTLTGAFSESQCFHSKDLTPLQNPLHEDQEHGNLNTIFETLLECSRLSFPIRTKDTEKQCNRGTDSADQTGCVVALTLIRRRQDSISNC